MVKRNFEKEADNFLIEYGAAVLSLNKKHPEYGYERVRGLEELHADGIKRIKALVAEFGAPDES